MSDAASGTPKCILATMARGFAPLLQKRDNVLCDFHHCRFRLVLEINLIDHQRDAGRREDSQDVQGASDDAVVRVVGIKLGQAVGDLGRQPPALSVKRQPYSNVRFAAIAAPHLRLSNDSSTTLRCH